MCGSVSSCKDREEHGVLPVEWAYEKMNLEEMKTRGVNCKELSFNFFSSSEMEVMLSSVGVALTCALCGKLVGQNDESGNAALVQPCGHYFCARCINTCIEKGVEETYGVRRARVVVGIEKEDCASDGARSSECGSACRRGVPTGSGQEEAKESGRLRCFKEGETVQRRRRSLPRRCFQCPICLGPAIKWTLMSPLPLISNLLCTLKAEMPLLCAFLERKAQGKEKIRDEQDLGRENNKGTTENKADFPTERGDRGCARVFSSKNEVRSSTSSSQQALCDTILEDSTSHLSATSRLEKTSPPLRSPRLSSSSSGMSPSMLPSATPLPPTTREVSVLHLASQQNGSASGCSRYPISSLEYSMDLFEVDHDSGAALLSFPTPLPDYASTLPPPLVSMDSSASSKAPPVSSVSSFFSLHAQGYSLSKATDTARIGAFYSSHDDPHRRKRQRSSSGASSSPSAPSSVPHSNFENEKRHEQEESTRHESESSMEEEERERHTRFIGAYRENRVHMLLDQSLSGEKERLLELKTYLGMVLRNCHGNVKQNWHYCGGGDRPPPWVAFRTFSAILVDERSGEASPPTLPHQDGRFTAPCEEGRGREVRGLCHALDGAIIEKSFSSSPLLIQQCLWEREKNKKRYDLVLGNWEPLKLSEQQWTALLGIPLPHGSSLEEGTVDSSGRSYWCWCLPALTPMICTVLIHPREEGPEKNGEEWNHWCLDLSACLKEIGRVPPSAPSSSLLPPFFFPLLHNWRRATDTEECFSHESMGEAEEARRVRAVIPVAWKRNGKVIGLETPQHNAFASLIRHHLGRLSCASSTLLGESLVWSAISSGGAASPPSPPSGSWIPTGAYAFFFLPDTWCREAIALLWWWMAQTNAMETEQKQKEHETRRDKEEEEEEGCVEGGGRSILQDRHPAIVTPQHQRSLWRPGSCQEEPCEKYHDRGKEFPWSSSSKTVQQWRRSCFQFLRQFKEKEKEDTVRLAPLDASPTAPLWSDETSGGKACGTAGFTLSSWQRLVHTAGGVVVEVSYSLWLSLLVYHLTIDIPILDILFDSKGRCRTPMSSGDAAEAEGRTQGRLAALALVQELSVLQGKASVFHPGGGVPVSAIPGEEKKVGKAGGTAGKDATKTWDKTRAEASEETRSTASSCTSFALRFHHCSLSSGVTRTRPYSLFSSSLPESTSEEGMRPLSSSSSSLPCAVGHLLLLHETLTENFMKECKGVMEGTRQRWITSVSPRRKKEEETESSSWWMPPPSIVRTWFSHFLTDIAKSLFLLSLLHPSLSARSPTILHDKGESKAALLSFLTEDLPIRAEARTAAWFLTNLAEGRQEAGVKRTTIPTTSSSFSSTWKDRSIYRPSSRSSISRCTTGTPSQHAPFFKDSEGGKSSTTEEESFVFANVSSILGAPMASREEANRAVIEPFHDDSPEMIRVDESTAACTGATSCEVRRADRVSESQHCIAMYPVFRNFLYEDSP